MLEISHYTSLDERLEAGPAFDELCQKCRRLNFLELFSGPRYGDIEDSFDQPTLDVCVGTIAELRESAEKCRLCYLISAFHDAQHYDPGVSGGGCRGDLELAILKPYRTDAALDMKDLSNDSDKESISTAIGLIFVHPASVLNRKGRAGVVLPLDSLSDAELDDIVSRAKKVISGEQQGKDPSGGSNLTTRGTKDCEFDAPQPDHASCSSVSSAKPKGQDSCISRMGMAEMEFRPKKLPEGAYWYHKCLFCLTKTSSLGQRRTLTFSSTAEGPKVDWQSLRGWIDACEKDHPKCRRNQVDLIAEEGFYIRCFDVKSSTIVPIDPQARYLALSYVWGTTHSELTEHISRCVIGSNSTVMTESLPSAIRDAIRVTERLGEQYLWVDSLCLDQRNPSAVATEIGFMDRIYSHAALTLVTSTSRDVDSEIPGLRPHSRLKSVSEVYIDDRVIKAVCAPTVNIEFRGAWQYRAWTFQEWILSTRCLFFSHNQILFRCQQLSGLESFQPPTSSSSSTSAVIPQFWADERCVATIRLLSGPALHDPTWNFQLYASLVCEYTSRDLTYASDILHAFTGILRTLERSNGTAFVEAMPAGDLLRALMWTSDTRGPQKYRQHELPSWTWAAYSSKATYRVWEVDGSSGEEALPTSGDSRSLGSMRSQVKRAGTLSFKSARNSKIPVVLSIRKNFEISSPHGFYRSYRLRCATVALLPPMKNITKSCLLLISETRSVLIHRNQPEPRFSSKLDHSTDDLLHPVTKDVIAGRSHTADDLESRNLLALNLSVEISDDESFSSHSAVLLYEWKIRGNVRKWHRKVVAMILDRLADGTVERLTLVSIRSKDWRTLPLLSEREELKLV